MEEKEMSLVDEMMKLLESHEPEDRIGQLIKMVRMCIGLLFLTLAVIIVGFMS